jgi:hypothetical protein
MTKDETQVSNIFIILNHIFFAVQKKNFKIESFETIKTLEVDRSKAHKKIINCQSASIHYQDYWLNNNDWGSYNEGFGTQCVVR